MLEYTQGDEKIEEIKIHYYRTGGDKPPFILLHGATDNGLCWTVTAERLSEQYDVIMPDAQGHGLSDRFDSNFTSRSHVIQLAGLVKALNLDKPLIMGHSMGGGTAVGVAVEYPDLPKAIVLEDPGWRPMATPRPVDDQAKTEEFRKTSKLRRESSLDEIIREGHNTNPTWSDDEIVVWAKSKQQFDPSLFSRPIISERSYEELIPEIRCPTLLVTAEDGLVSEEVAKHAAELWKSESPFRWVRIKGAGHNIRREQFPAFYKAVTDFLNELG
jgi:pimeloyl-ACP methyl ester carboxylesterase